MTTIKSGIRYLKKKVKLSPQQWMMARHYAVLRDRDVKVGDVALIEHRGYATAFIYSDGAWWSMLEKNWPVDWHINTRHVTPSHKCLEKNTWVVTSLRTMLQSIASCNICTICSRGTGFNWYWLQLYSVLYYQTAVGSLFSVSEAGGGGGGQSDEGMLINKSSNVSNLPVMYGNRRIGGTRVYTETTDAGGAVSGEEYLHIVLAFAHGRNTIQWNRLTK